MEGCNTSAPTAGTRFLPRRTPKRGQGRRGRHPIEHGNRDEALDLTAAYAKRKRGAYAGWAFLKGKDYLHDRKARLNFAALQRIIDALHKLGILKGSFDVRTQVDEAPVIEARARLK